MATECWRQGLLTSDNTGNVTAGDTVTIGSTTYTFRAAVSVANDVLIGGSVDASLLNLINTINLSGSAGTTYIAAQSANPEAYAFAAVAAHAITIVAKRPGTLGNIATTETAATLSWGNTTLIGGSVSRASLGWTKDFSALARGIYRAPAASGGSRTYLEVIDNTPDPTNGAPNARVQGLETVSLLGPGIALSSGSGQFANGVNEEWQKSSTTSCAPVNQRPWLLIGDDRTFYLFIQTGAPGVGIYYMYGFGDHRSLVAGDTYKGLILGRVGYNVIASGTSYTNDSSASNQSGVAGGHYLQRNWSGVAPGIQFGKQGDAGWRGQTYMGGQMGLPHGPDGGLYLSPVYIFEGSAGAYTQRGLMRGLYQLLHPMTSFTDGDTFAGSGDLAGRTFMIVKFVNSAGTFTGGYAVETTAWAS
jgi:hypothetical protein